jgi:hypothetical protein
MTGREDDPFPPSRKLLMKSCNIAAVEAEFSAVRSVICLSFQLYTLPPKKARKKTT